MPRYIDVDALQKQLCERYNEFMQAYFIDETYKKGYSNGYLEASILAENAPTADVVETEKYNELREAFVDFVCSGVHNPAPYCKNRCDECVDGYDLCTYRRCNGFNPDGKGEEQI